ncbi:hypothetical protein, partial [Spongiactinospora sp. TRM90649]|uniref:hypothetical protein n=1 Tax=Spongiactinospora sp. TRM90649 TaxID=3031114 RepID=UPI0023F9B57A
GASGVVHAQEQHDRPPVVFPLHPGQDEWIWSERPIHEAIITVEEYQCVQEILARRAHGS